MTANYDISCGPDRSIYYGLVLYHFYFTKSINIDHVTSVMLRVAIAGLPKSCDCDWRLGCDTSFGIVSPIKYFINKIVLWVIWWIFIGQPLLSNECVFWVLGKPV